MSVSVEAECLGTAQMPPPLVLGSPGGPGEGGRDCGTALLQAKVLLLPGLEGGGPCHAAEWSPGAAFLASCSEWPGQKPPGRGWVPSLKPGWVGTAEDPGPTPLGHKACSGPPWDSHCLWVWSTSQGRL